MATIIKMTLIALGLFAFVVFLLGLGVFVIFDTVRDFFWGDK